ncbi:SDR family NAD(P)-dependent oxidoreductase [Paraburkholderia largidicola]|uniref:Short-chain dehydrogenase n=1 Tax=Paraburkholderia largidicola TaxID=3014751 RepID=A0A7I8C338_9BURK|nr:SDR family NAD(P)-dependent oxidoreductase [Paraburkholderia sp. PGU16]BCF95055.1 short-chain dehydrogenase [Paraburkholderia sp. PGU16]
MIDFRSRYGRYALVTGASAGLGEEFARRLAALGMDLILVARRADKLDALASQLQLSSKVDIKTIALDLALPDSVDALKKQVKGLDVGLVILNAATLTVGSFLDNSVESQENVVTLNSVVPTRLAHAFGGEMRRKGRGGLLFVSSLIGYQAAAPYQASYAASKAYLSALSLAMHVELKEFGVDVTTLAPGPTLTEGFQNMVGIDFSKLPMKPMSTQPVVRLALEGLGKRAIVIPGVMNNFTDFLGKYVMGRVSGAKLFGA